jgi:hypothetical protein
MSTLFIGGPADGRRYDVPEAVQHWKVAVPGEVSWSGPVEAYRIADHAFYTARRFRVEGADFRIFVHEKWATRDAFERLLAHYKP